MAGDRLAAEAMVERYRRFARSKARRCFLVGADADDVEQEALIGLAKAIRDYRPAQGASFRAFAELCITRQVITAIKAATRQKHQALNRALPISGSSDGEAGDGAPLDALLAAADGDPLRAVEQAERSAVLRALLLERLSPFEVDALALHLEGHSYQHIGDELGRPAKAVDNALQRIRHKLTPVLA